MGFLKKIKYRNVILPYYFANEFKLYLKRNGGW